MIACFIIHFDTLTVVVFPSPSNTHVLCYISGLYTHVSDNVSSRFMFSLRLFYYFTPRTRSFFLADVDHGVNLYRFPSLDQTKTLHPCSLSLCQTHVMVVTTLPPTPSPSYPPPLVFLGPAVTFTDWVFRRGLE